MFEKCFVIVKNRNKDKKKQGIINQRNAPEEERGGVKKTKQSLLVARLCSNAITFSEVFDDSLSSTYQSDILIIVEAESKAPIFSTKRHTTHGQGIWIYAIFDEGDTVG
jgi:hypothetical protein